MEEHVALKKTWGDLNGRWIPHDTREKVIDFTNEWVEKTETPVARFIRWIWNWREQVLPVAPALWKG